MRCLIVEDEPLARERLTKFVKQLPLLTLSHVCESAPEAVTYLLQSQVDLLFLDVQLGGMSGLELLESAAVKCPVILTTAHADHAAKAFDLKVSDYLLKPFTFARFVQAVERARERVGQPPRAYLFVKTGARLEKVWLDDILYIQGDGDYRRIHTAEKELMTLLTFGELEQQIPSAIVCRVHKSYSVGIGKIESVERDRIRIGAKLIPISPMYREKFYALIF
jgi:two-component system LytT family response regulator